MVWIVSVQWGFWQSWISVSPTCHPSGRVGLFCVPSASWWALARCHPAENSPNSSQSFRLCFSSTFYSGCFSFQFGMKFWSWMCLSVAWPRGYPCAAGCVAPWKQSVAVTAEQAGSCSGSRVAGLAALPEPEPAPFQQALPCAPP